MKKNKAGFGGQSARVRQIFCFQNESQEASDEQKAEHNEGATGEVLAEGYV